MAEQNNSDNTKQETQIGPQAVPEPSKTIIPEQEKESERRTETSASKPKPPREMLVRLVGDDELKPFEEQTILIAISPD